MRARALLFSVLSCVAFMAVFVACTIMNDRHLPASQTTRSGADGGRVVDAGDPDGELIPDSGGLCSTTAPFTEIVPIRELNTDDDEALPRLTPDELSIYFYRADFDGGSQMLVADRATLGVPFGAPRPVLTQPEGPRMPAPSSDGRRLYFAVGVGDNLLVLWTAERAKLADPFGNARPLVGGTTEAVSSPVLADEPAGQRLYFVRSDAEGNEPATIFSSAVDPTGALVGPRTRISSANIVEDELDPTPSADGLTLYFYSEKEARLHGRIFVTHRTSLTAPFNEAQPVPEIPRPADGWVGVGHLSRDNCRLYGYQVLQTGDNANMFVARRLP